MKPGLLVIALIFVVGCSPDVADELPSGDSEQRDDVIELASFRDARSLAADPSGRLYVVDAAASTVTVLDRDGRILNTFGGAGTGDYSLLDPSDVDPSNGLDLFVADTGNQRIQRFSYDGEFIETISVPVGDAEAPSRVTGFHGRPISVAVGAGGSIYAAEEERHTVVQWEGNRRISHVFGLPADGEGALQQPVDLAVAANGDLLIADQTHGAIMVYTVLGNFSRTISGRSSGGVRSISVVRVEAGERYLVTGPHIIAIHDAGAGLLETLHPDVTEELVSAIASRGDVFVLTRRKLYRLE